MSDRKYKQRGYMDEEKPSRPSAPRSKDARPPSMPAVKQVFRCAICGATMPATLSAIAVDSRCSKCGADLHSCKNCVHFDPGARFECTQPINARIARKDLRNECEFFEARKTVERETTTSPSNISDPRAAFDRLFKK